MKKLITATRRSLLRATLALATLAASWAGTARGATTQYATGSFTWGTDSSWSSTSGSGYTEAWVSGNDAVLEGNSGTITIGSLTAHNITFNTTGYILSGAGTLTLTQDVTTSTITLASGVSVTIGDNTATVIGGSTGLIKFGAGQLTLKGSAVHVFTGGMKVNGGTLTLDFANLGTPTDLINSVNTLGLTGGGSLLIKGNSSGSTTQTLGNVTITSGTTAKMLIDPSNGTGTTFKFGTLGGITGIPNGTTLLLGKPVAAGNGTVTFDSGNFSDRASAGTGVNKAHLVITSDGGTTVDLTTTTVSGAQHLVATSSYTTFTGAANNDSGNFLLSGGLTLSTSTPITYGLKIASTGAGQSLDLNGLIPNIKGGLLVTGTDAYEIKNGNFRVPNSIGGNALDVMVYNTGGLTLSAAVLNNGTSSSTLTKGGPGTLTLSAVNTYVGPTYLTEGTLSISSIDNGGVSRSYTTTAGSATVTLTTGTTVGLAAGMSFSNAGQIPFGTTIASIVDATHLTLTSGTGVTDGSAQATLVGFKSSLGMATSAAGNLVIGTATLKYTGADAVTDRAFTIAANNTATFDITTNNITINGASAATTGGLTKTGSGTLTFDNTSHAFTGALIVEAGTLSVGIVNVSVTGPLGNSALPVVLGKAGSTGTLKYSGTTASSARMFTLATGGTGGFDITNATTTLTLTNAISGTGGLVKSGAGTLEFFTTAKTYTGDTTISDGTLKLSVASTLADSSSLKIVTGAGKNPKVELLAGIETIQALFIDDIQQFKGTWGSSTSGADNRSDTYFAGGSGNKLNVLTGPVRGTLVLFF